MARNFFIGSVGKPGDGYDEENRKRCIAQNAHIMHEDTKQKGVFNNVKPGDICFLKYKDVIIAFGEVKNVVILTDESLDGWTHYIYVKQWFFYSNDKERGVSKHGISEHTYVGAGQMATVKQLDPEFGLQKMKEIGGENNQLYELVKSEYTMNQLNNEITRSLLFNHNLILTGAPGTGKTYLAKQIAQQIAAQNTYNPKELLEQIIGKFKHSGEKTERLNELRSDFLKRFPKEKLKDLTLEQYCIGDGGKDNFCWWIERGLTALGKYFPGSSRSYLVYRNKESLDYVFTGFLKKIKASDINITNESLMNKLASEISECVEKKNNTNNYFGDSFLLKILSTYYPDEFFPINSKTYLDNVIDLFDLENKKDILEKNKVVYNFYKIACKDRNDITVDEFAYILYSNFDLKTGVAVDSLKQSDSKEDYGFVQFHPSYDYTDFVEGLRPVQDDNGNVGFERKDGVFKEFCINALNNPNKKFVFIIDEINRGEISKIFGELFFSIDPGYRGEKGKVRTQYANMQTEPNDFDDKLGIIDDNNFGHFFVPENVYIIGTMNDIDRSVESMDFAMRRRFAFKEIKAEDRVDMIKENETLSPHFDDIEKRMRNLNNCILSIQGLGSAYQIGASYFLKLENYLENDQLEESSWTDLWNNHIEGLLFEYLRGTPNTAKDMEKLKNAYMKPDDYKYNNDGKVVTKDNTNE